MLSPWLRNLFRRRTLDREMSEEMQLHIDLRAADLRRAGMSPGHASRQARLEFGNVTATMERAREAWSWTWLEQIVQDLRYAARGLRRSPLFTAVAVLSLALGIGTNTAVFSLVYSVLLERLPLPNPDELVMPEKVIEKLKNPGFSYGEYRAISRSPGLVPDRTTAISGMASEPVEVGAARSDLAVDLVDGNFFRATGLRPIRGRAITDDDLQRGNPVVVISTGVWRTLFGGADDVVGRTMKIKGSVFTVIGVTPAAYHGLAAAEEHDLIAPLSAGPLLGAPDLRAVQNPTLLVVARVSDPAARDAVAAAMAGVYQRCCAAGQLLASKGMATATSIALQDVSHGYVNPKFDFRATFGRVLLMLMGAVTGVLLIVCANVGSLLLGRATSRRRELAVRLSLGASRRRLARQLLAESLLLAVAGAGVGLGLARLGLSALARNLPGALGSLSGLVALRVDGTTLGFTALVSVFAVVVFGTLPVWRATRTDLVTPLKDGSVGNARTPVGLIDRGVIVVQVAMTLALVAASGLLATTLENLQHFDAGFASEKVVTAWLDTRQTSLAATGLGPITEELVGRLRALPGVRAVAMGLSVPQVGGRRSLTPIEVPGYTVSAGEDTWLETNEVTSDYFAATGIAIPLGRGFTTADRGGAPVAIVNQSFVKQYLAGRQPLGATIRFGGDSGRLLTIVGVAGDARYTDLRVPPSPMVYRPQSQMRLQEVGTLVVRGTGDEAALSAAVRAVIVQTAPDVRLRNMTTIEEAIRESLARERLAAALGMVFGAIALALAVIGLYGVVAYTVARRTSEIGVRMALGAQASDVVWQVFRHSLSLVGIGVAIGLPLALATGKAMASQLWGIGAHDPLLLVGSALLLAVAAAVASVVPAFRAARVDPLLALRAN